MTNRDWSKASDEELEIHISGCIDYSEEEETRGPVIFSGTRELARRYLARGKEIERLREGPAVCADCASHEAAMGMAIAVHQDQFCSCQCCIDALGILRAVLEKK